VRERETKEGEKGGKCKVGFRKKFLDNFTCLERRSHRILTRGRPRF